MLIINSFNSFEETVYLESGHAYFSYVHISQREKDMTSCNLYVFESKKLVMQCSGLRFHEASNDILDRLLGRSTSLSGHASQAQERVPQVSISGPDNLSIAHKQAYMESKPSPAQAQKEAPKMSRTTELGVEEKVGLDTKVFDSILESIAKGDGTEVSGFSDDTALVELGKF